jgi:hypothetical protein
MSIYRNPSRHPFGDPDGRVYAPVKGGPDGQAPVGSADSGAAKYGHLRKAIPNDALLPTTVSWAARLPVEVRPMQLMKQFARVANRVAATWRDAGAFYDCIGDLLIDRRGGRRGFPAEVSRELFLLRDYFEALEARRGER